MGNLEASVRDWSTEAADAFLNSKVPLNDSIRKIASRESLNREKVARVVEESNRQVFLKIFDKAPDKTFSFKVADVAEIVPAPRPAAAGGLSPAMVRVTPAPKEANQKTASQWLQERAENGTPLQIANDVFEKAILAVELLREKATIACDMRKAAEVEFCRTAQQMVGMEDYTFEELYKVACELRPETQKKVAVLLKVAAMHMDRTFRIPEMEKVANAPVDPGEHDIVTQISCSGMPVEIINGGHRLVVALDTLIAQDTEADRANKNLWSADDSVKYLRKEIRNYMASHRSA